MTLELNEKKITIQDNPVFKASMDLTNGQLQSKQLVLLIMIIEPGKPHKTKGQTKNFPFWGRNTPNACS